MRVLVLAAVGSRHGQCARNVRGVLEPEHVASTLQTQLKHHIPHEVILARRVERAVPDDEVAAADAAVAQLLQNVSEQARPSWEGRQISLAMSCSLVRQSIRSAGDGGFVMSCKV